MRCSGSCLEQVQGFRQEPSQPFLQMTVLSSTDSRSAINSAPLRGLKNTTKKEHSSLPLLSKVQILKENLLKVRSKRSAGNSTDFEIQNYCLNLCLLKTVIHLLPHFPPKLRQILFLKSVFIQLHCISVKVLINYGSTVR